MYCPHCGQHQISNKVRYCSRCGFSLKGVLAARQKDIVQGILLLFISLLLLIGLDFSQGFWQGWNEASGNYDIPPLSITPEVILLVFGTIFLVGGLLRILYAIAVEKKARRQQREKSLLSSNESPVTAELETRFNGVALLPLQSVPVADVLQHRREVVVAELPSVTEGTTRQLEIK